MRNLFEFKLSFRKQEQYYERWAKVARVILLVLFVVIVGVILVNFNLEEVEAFTEQNQNLSFLISFLTLFIASLAFIPTIPLTLVFVVFLGLWQATIITALGNTLSALVHYQIGKQLGHMVNFEEMKARLPFRLGELPVQSPLFLIIGRAIPGGPKWLSFVCGTYRVPGSLYLWTTFLTNFLGAALVAFGGEQLIRF